MGGRAASGSVARIASVTAAVRSDVIGWRDVTHYPRPAPGSKKGWSKSHTRVPPTRKDGSMALQNVRSTRRASSCSYGFQAKTYPWDRKKKKKKDLWQVNMERVAAGDIKGTLRAIIVRRVFSDIPQARGTFNVINLRAASKIWRLTKGTCIALGDDGLLFFEETERYTQTSFLRPPQTFSASGPDWLGKGRSARLGEGPVGALRARRGPRGAPGNAALPPGPIRAWLIR